MERIDLEFFRKILVQQKDELLRKGLCVFSDLREKESNLTDPLDMAADYTHQSCTLQICDRERRFLKNVTDALELIKSGEYGYCETCGEEILLARLKVQPVTRHCLECKISLEKREKTTFYSASITTHRMEADCE
ncbi:MAG: TraR/DksA C4-type zinc finger protein [Proteobacteria bacterium]|nr:TraR/DksA C4-type zinc finger protein [Pseudomonadota bacterium]MBU4468890.1 TraR/DksA C4-type zinc finger protein [Pseudomonadota bacterium]MCG2750883.1 TraR/DksA C4-type zinc finger protein [Desulfobacteraceae bacterium]